MSFAKAICYLPFVRFVILASLGGGLVMNSCCFSQDESLEQLQKQWSELNVKFTEAETAIESGEGDAESLRTNFENLVEQADQLVNKIDAAAVAKLASNPNDPAALRARMGIMLNEAQSAKFATVMNKGQELIKSGINPRYFEIASRSERLSIAAKEVFDELLIRQVEAKADDLPRVKLITSQGDIVVELFENEAPDTVGNFISLVESGHYNEMLFHRVVDSFMAQTGGFKLDAEGKEIGGEGPGYDIKCECYTPDRRLHFKDSLSMAHHGRDTGGSQFFLTFDRTSFLDDKHTCFGRIIEGHDTLKKLTRTHIPGSLSQSGREEPIAEVKMDRIIKAEVVRKRDHEYLPNKVVSKQPEEKATTSPGAAESDAESDADKDNADTGSIDNGDSAQANDGDVKATNSSSEPDKNQP